MKRNKYYILLYSFHFIILKIKLIVVRRPCNLSERRCDTDYQEIRGRRKERRENEGAVKL